MKRHLEPLSVYNRKFDIKRVEVEDLKLISLRFKLVGDIIARYGIIEEEIFNFDKTSFQIGVILTLKVITSSDRKGRLRTKQLGNRKWVTIIEAVNIRGLVIPLFVIFNSKVH